MDLWVEIQKYQSETRQSILKSIPKFADTTKDTQRILKSDDFLRILLSSIFSLDQICDITFHFFLKIFNTITINKQGEIESDHFNLFLFILEKNSQKMLKNFENCTIFCEILKNANGDFKNFCSPFMIKLVSNWLKEILKKFKEKNQRHENFKISCLILKFLKFELSEGSELEDEVFDMLENVIGDFEQEKGFWGLEGEIRYWVEKLWLMYMRRDDIVEVVAGNIEFLLEFDFERIIQKVKDFFLVWRIKNNFI